MSVKLNQYVDKKTVGSVVVGAFVLGAVLWGVRKLPNNGATRMIKDVADLAK